jgi:hypothetical protein
MFFMSYSKSFLTLVFLSCYCLVYAQSITSFFPTSATTGVHVTITFSGIDLESGSPVSAVGLNGVQASSFTVLNDTTIVAVVGAGALPGVTGNVAVTKSGTTYNRFGFTYYPPTPTASWPFSYLAKPTCSNPTLMPGVSCTIWPIINNGNWDDYNTWYGGRVPSNMDIICIPAGMTVKVSGSPYSGTVCPVNETTLPRLFIFVCGTIDFDENPAGKLYLGCQSAIQVWTGGTILSRGGSAEVINIGTKTVWGGPGNNNSDVVGPYFLNDGCGTNGCQGAGTLPAILSFFQGKLVETNSVNLSWTTTHEYNSSSFEIERSENGISWFKIGSVKSIGGERIVTNYSYSDRQPRPGKNLYRLKQIDQDGKHTYSEVVTIDVHAQKAMSYSIFPNPAKDKVTIYAKSGFAQGMQAQLYHKNGMLLETKYIQSANAQTMDISDLSNGLYFMRIVDANGATLHTQSVIKN